MGRRAPRRGRRWPWEDEYGLSEGLSAGWQLTLVSAVLIGFGLLVYWLNDMHMYGYGIFAR